MACNPISLGYAFCDNIKDAGAKAYGIVMPLGDWKAATLAVDGTSKNITTLSLAVGGKAYRWESGQPSNIIASSPYRAVAGGLDGYDHTVDLKIMYINQAQREDIIKLKYNKVVYILPLNNGDYLVYGGNVRSTTPGGLGLKLNGGDEIPSDATVGGLMQMILQTDPNSAAEEFPPFIIDKTVDVEALVVDNPLVG